MIEMLKARKERLEARGDKGFTLMEMLIVIAIIAILIAIAIPVFTSQLDKANASTDLSNIRSGYAQVQTKIMLNPESTVTTFGLNNDASVTDGAAGDYQCKGNNSDAGDTKIGGVEAHWTKGQKITYTIDGTTKELQSIEGAS